MKKSIIIRAVIDLLLFISIIHGWWFIALPLVMFGVWRLKYFIEIFIAGLIYDSLFGFVTSGDRFILGYIGIISSGVIFLLVKLFKNILRNGFV